MKKLLALVMALALCLSLGVCAMAADTVTATEATKVTASIEKVYRLVNSGTSPVDTFKFTVENYDVSDAADGVTVANMPTVTISDITVAGGDATTAGKSYDLEINLPSYSSVGVYTYRITETDNNIAGVSYDSTAYYLVVTVTQDNGVLSVSSYYLHSGSVDGVKTDNIDNTYTASKLTVAKNVTGNLGDKTKKFSFTVTFTTPDEKTWTPAVTVGGVAITLTEGRVSGTYTYTFTLASGESITFDNLPEDVAYSVVENILDENGEITGTATSSGKNGDYTVTYDNSVSGTISSTDANTTVTNDYDSEVDTGITLDSLPYVLVLVAVLALGAVMIIRKRRVED